MNFFYNSHGMLVQFTWQNLNIYKKLWSLVKIHKFKKECNSKVLQKAIKTAKKSTKSHFFKTYLANWTDLHGKIHILLDKLNF